MRSISVFVLLAALASVSKAQIPAAPAQPAAMNPAPASDLDRLQAAASQSNIEIAHMRIEKWKADSASKQQAQANADSLQRNLSNALPGLIAGFRAAPQDLNAGFRLYRNLTALYDVFASFTESAGAFGPRNDYEALAQQLNVIDSVRHNLGDNLENLTVAKEAELKQLQGRVQSLQQAAAAAASPPKKVIVDDTEPPKKTTHKKKSSTAGSSSSSSSQTSGSGSSSGTQPSSSKAQ